MSKQQTTDRSGGRFWTNEASESDQETSSSSGTESSEDEKHKITGARPGVKGRFAVGVESDSSESEEEKRVVRTSKDKKLDALLVIITGIRNQLRINNWIAIEEGFENLNKALRDASSVVAQTGVPTFYIKILIELEDAVNGVSKADTQKMSKVSAQAYNRVKMNLKKNNVTYQAKIDEFRANPDAASNRAGNEAEAAFNARGGKGLDDSEGSDSDSDDEVIMGRRFVVKLRGVANYSATKSASSSEDEYDQGSSNIGRSTGTSKGVVAEKATVAVDDEDDDSDSFGDSSSSDESSDDEAYKGLTGRARWVKREIVGKSKDEKAAEKEARRAGIEAKTKIKQDKKNKEDAKRAAETAAVSGSASTSATTVVDLATLENRSLDVNAVVQAKKWSPGMLEEEVDRVLALRGRRNADTKLLVTYLGALADKALEFGPAVGIPVVLHAISARFSLSSARIDDYLDRPSWKRSLRDVSTVLSILEQHPELRLAPVASEDIAEVMTKRSDKKGVLGKMGTETGEENTEESTTTNAASTTTASPKKKVMFSTSGGDVTSSATSTVTKAPEPVIDNDPNIIRIVGDLSVLIDRLQDEYIKSLQHMDPHKQDYVVRISDEAGLSAIADRAFEWYTRQVTVARGRKDEATVLLHEAGATRLAMLRIEHMYYKHDNIAYALRVAAATAEKRSEVASLAAAAAMQALEDARRSAVEANRIAATAAASANKDNSTSASNAGSKGKTDDKNDRETADAATKAIAAAANASTVGDAAARLASYAATSRGKKGYSVAAGVVAKALIIELSRREGGLLTGSAVEFSRNAAEMETLADLEALKALEDAQKAGIDLGDLRTEALQGGKPGEVAGVPMIDTSATIAKLAHYIYKHGDSRTKNRAVLCHVYHLALHDQFSAARDLMVMSRTQDSIASLTGEGKIQSSNVKVQILYNRALTMLGIAAFRTGQYAEAHECLAEICGGGHTKELLAQGITQVRHGQGERDPEVEREERRRLVPYHMHVNVDLADACHLTSAMLLEVPNIAAAEFDPRRREISKAFRRHLDYLDSKSFVGPPETTRDTIILAALALAEGEWRKAADFITGLKVWNLWSGRGGDRVKEGLVNAIKEAGLITYLHTYSQFYDSLSRESLCDMFQLTPSSVQSICSKLIYNGDLAAKWDQPTNTIVVMRAPPSKLQALALDFANHVVTLADNNEHMVQARASGSEKFFGDDRRGMVPGEGQYRRGRRTDLARQGPIGAGRAIIPTLRGGKGGNKGGNMNRNQQQQQQQNYASGRREYRQRGY